MHVEVVALACFNPVWGSLGVREERGEERWGEERDIYDTRDVF